MLAEGLNRPIAQRAIPDPLSDLGNNSLCILLTIRSGVVHVNCYGSGIISLPLGGMKQSGNGYDRSLHALYKFTNLKTAWFLY